MIVSLDLESYSEINIQDTGVYVYAQHPSTRVLIAVFDGLVWEPGSPKPQNILAHIAAGGHFSAFNAGFERIMWREIMVKRYGWPEVPLERWHCTAAQAAAMGLPKRLDHCGLFMGLTNIKDADGHTLMMRLSRPTKDGKQPVPTYDEMLRLISYCQGDVASEKELSQSIPQLSDEERKVWLLDQQINDRGLYVDLDFARAAGEFWDGYLQRINAEVQQLTGGLKGTQVGALVQWINRQGVPCYSLNKTLVQGLLDTELPSNVRRVLELRLEAGTTAVKKFPKFIECACSDSRVRGSLRYHGASTGRWAGNLIQPQNFPRGVLKAEQVPLAQQLVREKDVDAIDMLWDAGIGKVVGSLCRSVIVAPPGKKLIAGDYGQVEARGVAWLAKEPSMLRAFHEKQDVYLVMAGKIFGKAPDRCNDQERFLGKGTVLGCGYQMGHDRFKRQLKEMYNVTISVQLAKQCVYGYRNANPCTVALWGELEQAARLAIESNGDVRLRGLVFVRDRDWLFIILPSGRRLAYYKPKIGEDGISIIAPDHNNGLPYRESLYGGKITENVVSGICRDLLVHAMTGLESAHYTIVGSVHDEIITEVPDKPAWRIAEMQRIMVNKPLWAKGFPLVVEGWEGYYYRK